MAKFSALARRRLGNIVNRSNAIARWNAVFKSVKVPPPSEKESIQILNGVRDRYEKFHMVRYEPAAIESAVYQANRYIPDRFLPDKAIDLIDEAGARVKLLQDSLPKEMTEIQKKIKIIVSHMESAITNHEFDKAEIYRNEERVQMENLRSVKEKFNLSDTTWVW